MTRLSPKKSERRNGTYFGSWFQQPSWYSPSHKTSESPNFKIQKGFAYSLVSCRLDYKSHSKSRNCFTKMTNDGTSSSYYKVSRTDKHIYCPPSWKSMTTWTNNHYIHKQNLNKKKLDLQDLELTKRIWRCMPYQLLRLIPKKNLQGILCGLGSSFVRGIWNAFRSNLMPLPEWAPSILTWNHWICQH